MSHRPIPAGLADPDLAIVPSALPAAPALSAGWIAGQRWFRAKQRRIVAVRQADAARLGPAELRILEVAYADAGPTDRYLVPTVGGHEPLDGEGAWATMASAIADGIDLPSQHGGFVFRRTDALSALIPKQLTERRLRVEQSNTSVVLGDRLMLKLYRLLEPGGNPDLEVSLFLTDAGFADVPGVAGAVTYRDASGEAAAAMLAEYVPSIGDGWKAMLDALHVDPSEATALAGRIGQTTAAMHAALASRSSDAFPSRPAMPAETASWRDSAEGQLARAIGALSGEAHERLVELAPRATARFADAFGSASGVSRVTRIHGDFHLGQLLARADGGLAVIDFEGEPARPLVDRRQPGSPLRDVAGMLRSLDYAARTAERASGFDAAGWLAGARHTLLDAYGGIGSPQAHLLGAFELEKACYELRYEANNRPDWLWLPLAAVERLLTATEEAP